MTVSKTSVTQLLDAMDGHYIINHKKVYALMASFRPLNEPVKPTKRKYAKSRRALPTMPLEVIEMDNKFQWVEKHCRYAYILTMLNCYTRKVLRWIVSYSIKQHRVRHAWEEVIVNYLQPHQMLEQGITAEVRNDNDSRFAAAQNQQYMIDNHLKQVFTHPYTAQENGHVERFHEILYKSLKEKPLSTIGDPKDQQMHFCKTYNHVKLHGSLDHLAPHQFWKLWI